MIVFFFLIACNRNSEKYDTEASQEPEACPSNEEFYSSEVDPIIQTRCMGCHVSGGVAAETQIVLTNDTFQNYNVLNSVALIEEEDNYLLLLKPTNLHSEGHAGGAVLTTDSEEYSALEAFVAKENGLLDECGTTMDLSPSVEDFDCSDQGESPRLLRRLSHIEFENTITDLFGATSFSSQDFAADNVAFGYDNNASALQVSALLLDQYVEAANTISSEYVNSTQPSEWGCTSADRECVRNFLESKGTEIFRRPLSENDIESYLEVYDLAVEDGFDTGLIWTITAMLQSPHFLYRSELGERDLDNTFALTDWEIATELSYLIWQSTPDSTLLSLANDNQLQDPAVFEEQVQRLLLDSRSAETMLLMSNQWLNLRQLPFITRDPEVYGDLTAEIRSDLGMETEKFIRSLFIEDAPFENLLIAQETWLSPALSEYYQIDTSPSDWAVVDLSSDDRYGGILTHGSVLAVHSLPSSSSPIHRGLLVRERFLCQELPPPPANLDTSPPVVDPTLSTRERYEQHSIDPACSSCHDFIDPIGFAFENYDGIGRWRDLDGEHPIDASGEILQSLESDGIFYGVQELSNHLSTSEEVSKCYIQQWFTFGTGQGNTEEEEVHCGIEHANAHYKNSGGTLVSGLQSLTRLDRIIIRYGSAGEMDTLATSEPSGTNPDDPEDTGASDTSAPSDTGEPSEPIQVDLIENSNWGSGACYSVTVTNQSNSSQTWVITIEVTGVITSLWNALDAISSDGVEFSGVDWNATLQAQQSTEFGYCVQF